MTKYEIQSRIKILRNELEQRVKLGIFKIADSNGVPISTEELQNELYKLIYKLSKFQ
jgi:hypothetical protein